MEKPNAIWIDCENGLKALHMVEVNEAAELIPCAIRYLLDGIEPQGKSARFMEAFAVLLNGAELARGEG